MSNTRYVASDYFAEGMAVLEESGFPGLTAAGLCNRMGITRGSFYHYFGSFDDFVDQFLAYWEEHYSRELIARSASDDLGAQIRTQAEFAIGLPHHAEAAIRAWGTIDPRVAEAQRRVDQLRHQGLSDSLRRHGVSRKRADTHATIALATLVGMQMSQHPFDPRSLRAVYDELASALGKNLAAERKARAGAVS